MLLSNLSCNKFIKLLLIKILLSLLGYKLFMSKQFFNDVHETKKEKNAKRKSAELMIDNIHTKKLE